MPTLIYFYILPLYTVNALLKLSKCFNLVCTAFLLSTWSTYYKDIPLKPSICIIFSKQVVI